MEGRKKWRRKETTVFFKDWVSCAVTRLKQKPLTVIYLYKNTISIVLWCITVHLTALKLHINTKLIINKIHFNQLIIAALNYLDRCFWFLLFTLPSLI